MGSGSFGKLLFHWAPQRNSLTALSASYSGLLVFLGYVFEAIDPHTGESVAIKRTSKSGEYVSREFEVLEKLKPCKNCIQLLDIYYSKNEEGKKVQNLIFEYCS